MPHAAQFAATAETAHTLPALDQVAHLVWRAHGEGLLSDAAAQAVAEQLEARKAALRTRAAPQRSLASARRSPPRSPDRARSIARRRSLAASGAVPAKIAASFTPGEVAALTVIAREVQRLGDCRLCVDAIAAMAGTSRSVVKRALRQARALGLVEVEERPQPGRKHLPNIIRIAAPEWRAWLRLGDRGPKRDRPEYKDSFYAAQAVETARLKGPSRGRAAAETARPCAEAGRRVRT